MWPRFFAQRLRLQITQLMSNMLYTYSQFTEVQKQVFTTKKTFLFENLRFDNNGCDANATQHYCTWNVA